MPPSPILSRSRYLPKRSCPFAIMGGGAMSHSSDFSLVGCGVLSSDSSLSWLSPDGVGVENGGVKPEVLSLIFESSGDEDPRAVPSQVSRSRPPRRSSGCGCMCDLPKLGDTDLAGNR